MGSTRRGVMIKSRSWQLNKHGEAPDIKKLNKGRAGGAGGRCRRAVQAVDPKTVSKATETSRLNLYIAPTHQTRPLQPQ